MIFSNSGNWSCPSYDILSFGLSLSLDKHRKAYFVYWTELRLLFYRWYLCNFLLFEVSTTVVLFSSGLVRDTSLVKCCSSVRGQVCGSQPEAVSNCFPVWDQPHVNVSLNKILCAVCVTLRLHSEEQTLSHFPSILLIHDSKSDISQED